MDSLLTTHGFQKDEIENEWTKNNWVIRIYNNTFEIYSDIPMLGDNKYFMGELSKLPIILEEIE